MADQSGGGPANPQPPTPNPPANPYAAAEAAVLEQLWRAVGGEGEPLGVEMALARLALGQVAVSDLDPAKRAAAIWQGVRALVTVKLAQQRLLAAGGGGVLHEAEAIMHGLGVAPGAAPAEPVVEVTAALALLLLALDDLGHPEALAKVRELRAALAQPQPDVAYILELRRWFAARPGPARQAAARFFGTPAVAALLQAALTDVGLGVGG
jgi:hypothetical protein